MSSTKDAVVPLPKKWIWPLDVTRYNREPLFSMLEQQELRSFLDLKHFTQEAMRKTFTRMHHLERLVRPLRDVFAIIEGGQANKDRAMGLLLRTCAREERIVWEWARHNHAQDHRRDGPGMGIQRSLPERFSRCHLRSPARAWSSGTGGSDTRPLRTLTFSSRDCSWSPH